MSTFNSPNLPAESDFYSTHLELPSNETLLSQAGLPTTMDFPMLSDTNFLEVPQITTTPEVYPPPSNPLQTAWGGLTFSLASHDAASNWGAYQYLSNVLSCYNNLCTLTPPQSAHNSPNLLATTTPTDQMTAADTSSQSTAGPVRRNSTATRNRTRNRSRSESNHIKRPLNPFMIYRQEKHQELNRKRTGPGVPIGEVSKLIGSMWKRESKATQKYYYDRAEQLKQEHKAKYPDYKYNPRKSKQVTGAKRSRSNSSAGEASSELSLMPSPNFSLLHTPPMQGSSDTTYLSPDNHITSLNLTDLSNSTAMLEEASFAQFQAILLPSLGSQYTPDTSTIMEEFSTTSE